MQYSLLSSAIDLHCFFRGFEPQIREILNDVPKTKQMLLFTATWPKEVVRLAESYVNSNAVYINIGDDGLNANKAITQNFIMLEKPRGREKMQELVDLLQRLRTKPDDPKSIPKMILFCGRKSDCDYMEDDLKSEGYSCAALHGDKSQTSRDSIMDMFRRGRTRILIATDVASRGLDVRDVEVVVNYDFPPSGVEDYIHRIGRTARGERSGASYTFFTNSDETHAGDLFDILKKSGQEIPEELAQIVDRKRRPLPKKSKYGTRDSPSAGRYGIQRDRDNFRDTGFPRGGGFERRERSPPRRGGGDYDEDMEDYGSRGRRGMPESDRRGRGSAPSSRGSRNRFDDGDADDMFEERKSLREWR